VNKKSVVKKKLKPVATAPAMSREESRLAAERKKLEAAFNRDFNALLKRHPRITIGVTHPQIVIEAT